MLRVLRIGKEKLSDKGIASAAKRVGPLRLQTQLPRQAIIDRMIDEFASSYGLIDDELTNDERSAAEELTTNKYATPEWTFAIP
jgi:lipoate-protein ligase A